MKKLDKGNVIIARTNNPCATLQEIGNCFGVTRERIRQILSQAGSPAPAYRQTYLCIHCGKDVGTRKTRLFCNRQCRHDYTHTQIACSHCGKLREYGIKDVVWQIEHGGRSGELFFCSKQCQGAWLAENHGFGKHPENRSAEIKRKK